MMRIVHEGRGGYIEIDGRRYCIEHTEGGRFCIHFPSGHRHATRPADLEQLRELVRAEPAHWELDDRTRRRR
jgi:hypothetical protein